MPSMDDERPPVEAEIGVHRRDAESYSVELRFQQPESETDIRVVSDESTLVEFDLARFRALELDPDGYGRLLGQSLFADAAIGAEFAKARASAQTLEAPLRIRLFIGPSAPELHGLRWETLRDPSDGSSLVTHEQILFSRYLSSRDWRPVRLRSRHDLRALVVIANPADIEAHRLAPIDVKAELARAQAGLEGIDITDLASGGTATLNCIFDKLREGYDILYLACHGALKERQPKLWLEDELGNAAEISGAELVTRFNELREPPTLVVLASCQSARGDAQALSSDGRVLTALGPQLCQAGASAVLGMQGNITIRTVAAFVPVFFKELQRDGQIDRAMAVARGAVRERDDSWMPTLFMRLRNGKFWYVPGFEEFRKWPALLSSIQDENCTPILGSGLTESIIGSSREIAQRWAEHRKFPMAPHYRDDLPQVSQYWAVTQNIRAARRDLRHFLVQEIVRRYGQDLAPELSGASLDRLVDAVGELRRQRDPSEPHKVLAQFPFAIYITANVDNLLERALSEAGKDPQSALSPWNEMVETLPTIFDEEPNYRPSVERPLVFHLFGRLQEPESVVLTEDDYFDYLIGMTANKELIPKAVRSALANSALLFLGFQMDDWDFRVLFRSLMRQEGQERRRRYSEAHAAAQLSPDETRVVDPESARRYLKSSFLPNNISIYWGSTEDFVKELQTRWSDEVNSNTWMATTG